VIGTFDPTARRVILLASAAEVVAVTDETLLAELMRVWADKELPDEPFVAERAAAVARTSYSRGESLSEACRQARCYVKSWTRHPSYRRAVRDVARLAS